MPNAVASPLVSVIMPAYNHEHYVAAAIESVLDQTWRNIELIVIDDASSDRTWEVIAGFADARIRASRHTVNQGAHRTLNEALGMAQGAFVAIINSDDVFVSTRIAECLDALRETGADLAGSDIVLIDSMGEPLHEHWWIRSFTDLKRIWAETGDWQTTLLYGNVFMTTSNCVFRRDWLESAGDFRDYRYVLDYEWLLRGLIDGRRLVWLNAPLLHYRLHESNTISERPLAANLECAAMLRALAPQLLAEDARARQRLESLAAQWARIERYLGEIWATLRHEALLAKEAELLPRIAERDAWIAERDLLITRQAEWVEDRDRWLSERDTVISIQATSIADRDRWIAERDGWIAERDGWIADRDRWIAERDAHIAAVSASLLECRAEKSLLESGMSYRLGRKLTAPLRWLRGVFATR